MLRVAQEEETTGQVRAFFFCFLSRSHRLSISRISIGLFGVLFSCVSIGLLCLVFPLVLFSSCFHWSFISRVSFGLFGVLFFFVSLFSCFVSFVFGPGKICPVLGIVRPGSRQIA
jgi:hypothetical protein